jgi:hypothetical protein
MQYLLALLMIAGVTVLMVGGVLGLSYAFGAFLNAREAARTGSDPCAQCQADRDWYDELPLWKRNVVTAWWLANRYHCAARGCR